MVIRIIRGTTTAAAAIGAVGAGQREGSCDHAGGLRSRVRRHLELRGGVGPFADWLRETRGWPLEYGWAACIKANAGSRPPLGVFFGLLDKYRSRSRPQAQQDKPE